MAGGSADAPPAPPLPDIRSVEKSSIALKVRAAPPGWVFEGSVTKPHWDGLSPPTGLYFFYGTLQDPGILGEVLQLPETPTLSPAYTVGYAMKSWGQYPALVDGPAGAVINGAAYDVSDDQMAARLAEYETKAYRAAPCSIRVRCGEDEEVILGYTFVYSGNPADLDEGSFDLDVWLRRMGRKR